MVRNMVKVSHQGNKAVINELALKCYGSAPCYNKTTCEDSRVQEVSSPGVDVLHRRGSCDLAVCVRALTIFFFHLSFHRESVFLQPCDAFWRSSKGWSKRNAKTLAIT